MSYKGVYTIDRTLPAMFWIVCEMLAGFALGCFRESDGRDSNRHGTDNGGVRQGRSTCSKPSELERYCLSMMGTLY